MFDSALVICRLAVLTPPTTGSSLTYRAHTATAGAECSKIRISEPCSWHHQHLSLLPFLQSWDVFFRNANAGAPPGAAYQSPLGLSAASSLVAPQLSSLVGAQPNVEKLVEDHLAVQSLIRAYQVHTHKHDQCIHKIIEKPVFVSDL